MAGSTTKAPDSVETDFRSEALLRFYQQTSKGTGTKRVKLYRAMLEMIENGFWNPGDRLPTDLEFTNQLPLSLATVQASLQMLAEQDLIIREKRNGSFVATEDRLSRDLIFFRFLKPDTNNPLETEDLTLEVTETSRSGPWVGFLGIRDRYVLLSRTIAIGNEFRVRSEFYFANPRLRVLLDVSTQSLKGLAIRPYLHFKFGLPTIAVNWEISFKALDLALADMMGVAQAQMSQQFDVMLTTIGDEPLAYHRFWVPPNNCRMQILPFTSK